MLLCSLMRVLGPGIGKFYCLQRSVSDIQMVRNVTVCSGGCLRYRVREVLLFKGMCV